MRIVNIYVRVRTKHFFALPLLILIILNSFSVPQKLEAQQAPKLQTIDAATYDRIATPTVILFIEMLRQNPDLLDTYIQPFAMINNCVSNDRATNINAMNSIYATMKNEFSRPQMLAFYKSKAASILSALPQKTFVVSITGPNIGEYNLTTHMFPFWRAEDKGVTLEAVAWPSGFSDANYTNKGCEFGLLPHVTQLAFIPHLHLATLPVSEENAKAFVESLDPSKSAIRSTEFVNELSITRITPPAPGGQNFRVEVEVKKITVNGIGAASKRTLLTTLDPQTLIVKDSSTTKPADAAAKPADAPGTKSISLKDVFKKKPAQ